MPSPVAHTLAGCCLAAMAARRGPTLATPAFGAALVAAANLPDLDFLGVFVGVPATTAHQAGTHSIAFVLAAAVPLALLARGAAPRLQACRWLALAGLAHLGLDLVNFDGLAPFGIPLCWPFSDARWLAPVALFPGIDRSRLFGARNLLELAAELAVMLPLLAWVLRERIAGLLRGEAAYATVPDGPDDEDRTQP